MHAGDGGDFEALGLQTESATGQAIASGTKRRASDKDIWLEGLPMGPDVLNDRFFLVGKIAIAAHERRHDLALPSQGLFQQSPWSERPRVDTHWRMRFGFPTHTTEKGIQVMHHT